MSLIAFRDYCRAMAEETEEPRDRDLWTQLARELDAYLDDRRPTVSSLGPPPIDPDELLFVLEEQVAEKRARESGTTPDP